MKEIDFIQPKKTVGKLINIEVLDEIRSEIEQKIVRRSGLSHTRSERDRNDAFLEVLDIVDKYRKEQEDNGFFDEIMDDESEDEETYEKIKEIIAKVKEQENMNPLDEYIPMVEEMKQMMQGDTDEKIATLTECEESYAKGYEDGRKAGHLEGCRDEYEAMASYLRSVLEELRP